MMLRETDIAFRIGCRRVFGLTRKLVIASYSLQDILTGRRHQIGHLPDGGQGYRLQSLPAGEIAAVKRMFPNMIAHIMDGYPRYFIEMDGSYDEYLSGFSGKTRSTLRRKVRKFAALDGRDKPDIRTYHDPSQIADFFKLASGLSAKTYQERLLDAGLPASSEDRDHAIGLARENRLRLFLLFSGGKPVSYLYLPVEGDTLIYAHLGYDPSYAKHSPGTVLQMLALEELFAEQRFSYFDFTEGEGPHKRLFATGHVDCATLLLLENGMANRLLPAATGLLESAVAGLGELAEKTGTKPALRRMLRA